MGERFRKKSVEVEAVQWTGENAAEVGEFTAPDVPRMDGHTRSLYLGLGDYALVGDFIVRNPDGETQPVSAADFEATYEPAGQEQGELEGAMHDLASTIGRARVLVGGRVGLEKELDDAADAVKRLRVALASASSQPVLDVEGLREKLLSDEVIDRVAEERAIEYGHWEDFPAKEANQKRRYAQLAKKPGVQESWKEGARVEVERLLAALSDLEGRDGGGGSDV